MLYGVAYSPLLPDVRAHIIIIGGGVVVTESFGCRVRRLRLARGESQEQFAAAIGLDRSYYASAELGKRNVSLLNIKKIADGFGI
ncbi:MAG: helix-turn-helix transcriptional regulator, partial [Oscillospiraceae bacterium]|nr:helix-turn-helix transcriptional regulator [Oscillospiraceae bacterium]